MRRGLAWLVVLSLTAALTATTIVQALRRYEALQTGWSWDLAYYNQWFWALTKGDGRLTVRPIGPYADEGPSIWKMNYLAPIRFLIAPIYAEFPDPTTLLVVQNVVFWWIVPAAFVLAVGESGSCLVALSATALVPLTPLLWPLAWNDFRELQLALPFLLWAVAGVRARDVGLAVLGVGGMLACRQEFAVVVASLAFVPPRAAEGRDRTYRWMRALWVVGLAWLLFGFFGYLWLAIGPGAPEAYLAQFGGPKPPIGQVAETSLDFLVVGLGAWAALACLAPRVGLLALPWVWSLAGGKWALRLIGSTQWHHVRYTAPMVGLVLAAGLIGYARLAGRLNSRPRGWIGVAGLWLATLLGLYAPLQQLAGRLEGIPVTIAEEEASEVWDWLRAVQPDDGVLAVYEVTAPLSSRRLLYSYVLDQNKPKGYPDRLDPAIRWAFIRNHDIDPKVLKAQGFECVYRGDFLWIFRRSGG